MKAKSAFSGVSNRYSRPSMTRISLPAASSVPTPVGRIEPAEPGAAGADALDQRALRHQLELDLAREIALAELGRGRGRETSRSVGARGRP